MMMLGFVLMMKMFRVGREMDKEMRRGPVAAGGGDYFISMSIIIIIIMGIMSMSIMMMIRSSSRAKARTGGRPWAVESTASRSSG